MEHVLFYLHALARLVEHAFILCPMPFGSYQTSNEDALHHASRLMKAGAESLKLEGGGSTIERVQALAEVGIPCAGHLGYTPQQFHCLGGQRVVGDTAEEAYQLCQDALGLEEAGAWGVILQNVPDPVARTVRERSGLITIGAGGTRGCDGQMAPIHDLLGWPQRVKPLFSVQYGDFFNRAVAALNRHCAEVQELRFPSKEHTFSISEDEFDAFTKQIGER
jgi:3-methyl-2-oxobutanoate hydroxymethyltransferase